MRNKNVYRSADLHTIIPLRDKRNNTMLFKFIVSTVVLLLTFNAASAAIQKTSAVELKKAGNKALRHMLDHMVPEPGQFIFLGLFRRTIILLIYFRF